MVILQDDVLEYAPSSNLATAPHAQTESQTQQPPIPEGDMHEFNVHGDFRRSSPQSSTPLTVDAITKAVEVALHNFLGQNSSLRPDKRSPRRRWVEDREVELEKASEPSHHRDFILVSHPVVRLIRG